MKVRPGSHHTAEQAAYKNVARRAAIGIEVVSDEVSLGLCDDPEFHEKMARPERFELPTLCFEGRCSIQLSYGRADWNDSRSFACRPATSSYFGVPAGWIVE